MAASTCAGCVSHAEILSRTGLGDYSGSHTPSKVTHERRKLNGVTGVKAGEETYLDDVLAKLQDRYRVGGCNHSLTKIYTI